LVQLPDAPAVRIVVVEMQRRFGVDVRPARDGRHDAAALAVEPAIAGAEGAADDALLHPALAFRELAVGGEARELRARPRTARRAVVRLARTQHEAARACAARARCAEELDVIDVGMPLRVER